jgi:hypothetical protein
VQRLTVKLAEEVATSKTQTAEVQRLTAEMQRLTAQLAEEMAKATGRTQTAQLGEELHPWVMDGLPQPRELEN